MKKLNYLIIPILITGTLSFTNCSKQKEEVPTYSANSKSNSINAEIAFPGKTGQAKTLSPNIQYVDIDGNAVLEGDIILSEEQLSTEKTNSTGRSLLSARWPSNTVYYKIHPSLTGIDRITEAVAHWQSRTTIQFIQNSVTNPTSYVYFVPGDGCSSYVGRTGGVQNIVVATGCSTGNVIHEIGHALGLWHEQSRTDRDQFIKINYANILSGYEVNFYTYTQQGADGFNLGTLDYGSIMMYGPYFFSKNGSPTITKLDGSLFVEQRSGVSSADLDGVLTMYPHPMGSALKPVFRGRNPRNSFRIFSNSYDEIKNNSIYESIELYIYPTQVSGTVPIYKFYKTIGSGYMYTKNYNEGIASGYSYQSILGYAYATNTNGTVPIYRLYNATTGDHLIVKNTRGFSSDYINEGVGFYAY